MPMLETRQYLHSTLKLSSLYWLSQGQLSLIDLCLIVSLGFRDRVSWLLIPIEIGA